MELEDLSMDFQKLSKNIMSNKTRAFSLVEVLVAMIVGSLMVAAIYFAYGVFSKTYLTTIQKISVFLCFLVNFQSRKIAHYHL